MDFALTANQESIRDAVAKICARFDDAYWLKKDKEGGFPADFHKALADAGWLGICIPEAYGGSGLGITDAAIMMRTIAESGAGMSGASAVHMNVFGLNPVVVFGTEEQCKRLRSARNSFSVLSLRRCWACRSPTDMAEIGILHLSFRDAPLGEGPESIHPIVVMDSGLDAAHRPGMTNGEISPS